MRREQAGWRLSAVLLSLLLAFGAATYRVASANPSAQTGAPDSPAAVMMTGATGGTQTVVEKRGHHRLTVTRGHAGALLFLAAVAALLARVRRPLAWSLAATPPWPLPATVGTWASRGRAPPAAPRPA